jgi:hypothetical protein
MLLALVRIDYHAQYLCDTFYTRPGIRSPVRLHANRYIAVKHLNARPLDQHLHSRTS